MRNTLDGMRFIFVMVGEAFEKDFQEMDQHLVLHMGKILQQAGFGVYAR